MGCETSGGCGDPYFKLELSGVSPASFQPSLSVTRATTSVLFLAPSPLFLPPPGLPGVTRNLRAAKTSSRSFMAAGMAQRAGGGSVASVPFIGST